MEQTLDLTNIHAVLFDMDGTMVDNTAYHKKAWEEFYKRHHMEFSDEDFRVKFSGKNNKQIFQMIFGEDIFDEEVNKFADEKESLYRELYAPYIKPIDGLLEFIEKLKQKGIKIAVATTAIKENRDFILNALKLNNTFDAIIGYEDVAKGKPDPEIFLKAATALNVKPETCIVFDDAPSGIEAAKRVGMKTVGLLTSHTKEELNADNTIIDFQLL
ncbi:MAG TPA: HAD family phosphatase [Candidatus Saccharimonadales bacterium]|nr:HAD family phosphatase [Candidatus Saccharimonadales bacterium]